jgi:hypothetical protein
MSTPDTGLWQKTLEFLNLPQKATSGGREGGRNGIKNVNDAAEPERVLSERRARRRWLVTERHMSPKEHQEFQKRTHALADAIQARKDAELDLMDHEKDFNDYRKHLIGKYASEATEDE